MAKRRRVPSPPPPATRPRLGGIDMLRGAAIVLMVVYHVCFDLNHFGLIRQDMNHDLFWLSFRALIVSAFAALVGVSLVLAGRNGFDERAYWRRCAILAGAAVLVSAGSYLMFPRTFIWFGILHFILVASLLGRPFVARPRLAFILGVLVIAAGAFLASPVFDQPALQWIGFMTHKPLTEDYVPLAPWFGVVLTGISAGRLVMDTPGWRSALERRGNRPIQWLGRHSLAIYLLHQPVLMGVLALAQPH